jgi:hypothetical protein
MMSMSPFLSFATVIGIMTALMSAAAAQEICTCDGDLLPPSFSGGDSAPLAWKYAPYMKSLGSGKDEKLICYLKVVSNHGNSDVRSVRWEVANFFDGLSQASKRDQLAPWWQAKQNLRRPMASFILVFRPTDMTQQ